MNFPISLVMPILTREVTIHMDPGNSSNATIDLSNLGFLLGTIPAAPGTLFYAMQYNVAVDMVRHHIKLQHIWYNMNEGNHHIITGCNGNGGLHFRFRSVDFRFRTDGFTLLRQSDRLYRTS